MRAASRKQSARRTGECAIVELDLVSEESIASAFAAIRRDAGDPDVLVYNAGYLEGRDLPPDKELLEYIPVEMFDTAQHIASRGPFLVAKEVLPAMRRRGTGSFLFSNNSRSLRGKKRYTGESLYYPRVMMRTLAQVLTEEYSEHGIHVANVVIDGTIDSPGTHALPKVQNRPELVINPVKIAEAFWYLHTQDRSCWTHELQAYAVLHDAELLRREAEAIPPVIARNASTKRSRLSLRGAQRRSSLPRAALGRPRALRRRLPRRSAFRNDINKPMTWITQ